MLVRLFVLVFFAFVSQLEIANSQTNQSQTVPDFNGQFVLESVNGNKPTGDTKLIISQVGAELRLARESVNAGTTQKSVFTYYTDGRGETNLYPELYPYKEKVKSVTTWKKDELIVKFSLPSTMVNNQVLVNEGVHQFKLSQDGQSLTVISSFTVEPAKTDASSNPFASPRSPNPITTPIKRSEKRIYRRI